VLNGLWLGLSLLMLPANASGRREVAASPRLFGLFRVNPVAGDWIPSNSVPGFSPYPGTSGRVLAEQSWSAFNQRGRPAKSKGYA
jgi:hypothetical protein